MKLSITTNNPVRIVNEAIEHYQKEYYALNRRAGLVKGIAKKELEAQARYASRQIDFWTAVEITIPE